MFCKESLKMQRSGTTRNLERTKQGRHKIYDCHSCVIQQICWIWLELRFLWKRKSVKLPRSSEIAFRLCCFTLFRLNWLWSFPLESAAEFGIRLYRFLIIAFHLLNQRMKTKICIVFNHHLHLCVLFFFFFFAKHKLLRSMENPFL